MSNNHRHVEDNWSDYKKYDDRKRHSKHDRTQRELKHRDFSDDRSDQVQVPCENYYEDF